MLPHDLLREQLGGLRKAMIESQQLVRKAHRAAAERRVTVRSTDGEATLELDGTGAVRGLVFHDDSFRDLDAEDLSALVVDLFTRGQADVRAQALGAMPASPVSGLTPQQLLDPDTDLEALVPQDLFAQVLDSTGTRTRRGEPGDQEA